MSEEHLKNSVTMNYELYEREKKGFQPQIFIDYFELLKTLSVSFPRRRESIFRRYQNREWTPMNANEYERGGTARRAQKDFQPRKGTKNTKGGKAETEILQPQMNA